MIRIKATGFPQFFAAHAVLRAAGVNAIAGGGNEMRVPDDTDRDVLRSVAATGATVYADLTDPATAASAEDGQSPAPEPDNDSDGDAPADVQEAAPQVDTPPETDAPAPKRTPRKTSTRRTKE